MSKLISAKLWTLILVGIEALIDKPYKKENILSTEVLPAGNDDNQQQTGWNNLILYSNHLAIKTHNCLISESVVFTLLPQVLAQ